ncbi:MAG: hypothetical protein D3924_20005, partial [Candidatus Electrothrix sp. AR4]|nr:hypothetical protein [Candidatus Electrothrix sp. AR4]
MKKTPLFLGMLVAFSLVTPCGAQSPAGDIEDLDVDMMAREYKKTSSDAGALTREMIEGCIALKIKMEADDAKLDDLRKQVQKLNNEVRDLGAYLKNNKGQFDENDTSAARAKYDAKVDDYNSRIPALKKLTQTYQDMLKPPPE